MNSITLTIPIRDGKLELTEQHQAAIDRFVAKLPSVKMRLERPGSVRSLEQNSFYWQVLTTIANETGNEKEALHEYCKLRFLPRMFVKLKDKEIELQKSTRKLSPKEMAQYITEVISLAGELGILIPLEQSA